MNRATRPSGGFGFSAHSDARSGNASEQESRARESRARHPLHTSVPASTGSTMVLYELMVMVKSATPRAQLADILRRAGTRVLDAGGVITDITSFGTRPLAYEFKSPGERHFEVRVVDRSVRRCGPSRRSSPRRARVSGGTHPQAAIFFLPLNLTINPGSPLPVRPAHAGPHGADILQLRSHAD